MNDIKKRIPVILFSLTLIAFLAFFLYMYTSEKVSVYRAEPTHSYVVLTDLEMELVEDAAAPAGVRKVYRGTIDPDRSAESCLLFNIAHHEIEVFFDGEPAYRLTVSEQNRIGQNVSSNWCTVHVGQEHGGAELVVVLTPMFEEAIGKTPEFYLGSDYAVALEKVAGELPLLVLSSLCILLGLFVAVVFLCFRFVLKSNSTGTIYLGFFSIAIGLWKLSDLRCITLLFPQHALAIGYISVGALFLSGLCLMLYFSTLFEKGRRLLPQVLSCGASLICLAVLVMQLLGIAEIRQNLVLSHVILIVAIATIPMTSLFNRIVYKNGDVAGSWKWLLLVFVGIAVDLLYYYRHDRNGLMSFSIMGLIVYILIMFLLSVRATTQKAYTDSRTGLVNRARWTELMHDNRAAQEAYAILMIDMNGLKQVNDTLGHDVGDRMIFNLADMLRRTLPRRSVICRWGGDEFAVLLTDIDREQLDLQMDRLNAAGERYNHEQPELPIHFAVGAVLSSEHPGLSKSELFDLADEQMYSQKKAWYAKREGTTAQ